jgi:hypothetical protein
MSYTLTCYTLFDITQTGVLNRSRPQDQVNPEWLYKRNTQCNFDTIIQAISLRSLPEVKRGPEKMKIRFDEFENFGFLFQQQGDEEYDCWSFDFEIQHTSVFNDGITELGALYTDCDRIPMILCKTEWEKLPNFLDTSDELRNIYFKVISND